MASPLQSPRGGVLGDLPDEFRCPLSGDIMTDPVTLVETGQNFQRAAIEDSFARGLDTCPQTKAHLTSSRLAANTELKLRVLAWLKAKRAELQAQARSAPLETQLAASAMGSSPGGKDPGQLANLIRQGRLNELIRQVSSGPGSDDAAADAAVAAVDGKPEASAGSTAKGVARLNLDRDSAGKQPGGSGGGGYAKAPPRLALRRDSSTSPLPSPRARAHPPEALLSATPKQAPPRSPTSDGDSGRAASTTQYVRPPPAALQSPRTTAPAGPYVPKCLPNTADQPVAQQPESAPAQPPPPPQQQQPPPPPPPPPQQQQQPHSTQDDAPQQQQNHPHGPPPKTPSFDQWAHHDADIPAIASVTLPHGSNTAAAPDTLPPVPEQHPAPQQDVTEVGAASSQPAAAAAQVAAAQVPEQRADQPWLGTGGSMQPTAVPDAATGQMTAPWHSAEQLSTEGPEAAAAGRQGAEAADAAASSSQHWQPPAASASDAQQSWQAQEQVPQQHQHQQLNWQHQKQHAVQEPDPLQHHQQQHDWQQQQQQQAQQQQPPPYSEHSWQQPEQSPPPGTSTSDPSGHSHGAHQQQQSWQQSQHEAEAAHVPMSQPEWQQQPEQYDPRQLPQQQQPQPQQPQQYSQQYDQQPPQQAPYHHEQQAVTHKPPTSESYTWQDPAAGSHTYQSASSGYRQDSYSTTLATIAAAKERWGNTTRFPEWQPPQDSQGGAPANMPQLSLAQRAQMQQQEQQQQQEAAAVAPGGQQYYGGPSANGSYHDAQQPASGAGPTAGYYTQAGGTTFVNRFGQREPDYSYYTG